MTPPPPLRGWSWVSAAMLGDIEPPPRVCSKEGVKRYPERVAHGPEAPKPSHPHERHHHCLSAGYPFSLIREIRNPSLNHEIDVELP